MDIQPGKAKPPILEFRISAAADTAAARMPPIARSLVDTKGHILVKDWINKTVDSR